MDCHNNHQNTSTEKKPASWPKILILCIVAAAAVIALIKFMKIPLGTLLPYAILLLCPVMHIFMMRGHGGHDKGQPDKH